MLKNGVYPEGIITTEGMPGLLSHTLATDFPEVQNAVPVIPVSWFDKKAILISGNQTIEANAQFVGVDFLQVFSYPLIEGENKNALKNRHGILISDELAAKLFGYPNGATGKTIECNMKDYSGAYLISGVFKKPPSNSTMQFDMLLNYELFLDKNPKLADWRNTEPYTYVVLQNGTDVQQFNSKIRDVIKSKASGSKQTLFVQKYSDRYLYNTYENGIQSGGRIEYVKLFGIIAVLIMMIACINFMNLSTASAAARMKDAGIKKIIGSSRRFLIVQYLSESAVTAAIATLVAIFFIVLLLPTFNAITEKNISLPITPSSTAGVLSIIVATALIAGFYPSIYLSGFKATEAIKGKIKKSAGELIVRKGLVIFQFALSAIFIVSFFVINRQMSLIQSKNLGYNRDHVIYFDRGGMISENKEDYAPGGKYETNLATFIQQVKKVPGVENAANFRHDITNRNGGTTDISWPGKDPNSSMNFTDLGVGYDFIETIGIKMKEGRSYSRDFSSENSKIVLNEKAVEQMGLKDPVGKTIHLWGSDREIIGVTNNFNFQSFYTEITPCFFDLTTNHRASKIMVRIRAGQERTTIPLLEKLYKTETNGLAFNYRFVDEDFQGLYASERKVAALSTYFSALAIIISCLGLLGLMAFIAQRKHKEISIRKVLGATAANIVVLLSKDFLILVGVAIIIAFPFAFWLMNQWLHNFAYRTDIGYDIFVAAASGILILTFCTIGFHALKAAIRNPVESLRTT